MSHHPHNEQRLTNAHCFAICILTAIFCGLIIYCVRWDYDRQIVRLHEKMAARSEIIDELQGSVGFLKSRLELSEKERASNDSELFDLLEVQRQLELKIERIERERTELAAALVKCRKENELGQPSQLIPIPDVDPPGPAEAPAPIPEIVPPPKVAICQCGCGKPLDQCNCCQAQLQRRKGKP